jgi:hypothetical protein
MIFNVANATALRQLRDEWSANTYATRIKRLLGQTPGSAFVFRTSGVNQNVFSDTSVDRLTGANDSDWSSATSPVLARSTSPTVQARRRRRTCKRIAPLPF